MTITLFTPSGRSGIYENCVVRNLSPLDFTGTNEAGKTKEVVTTLPYYLVRTPLEEAKAAAATLSMSVKERGTAQIARRVV